MRTLLKQIDRLDEYLHLESDINEKDFKYIDTMLKSIQNEALNISNILEKIEPLKCDFCGSDEIYKNRDLGIYKCKCGATKVF